MQNSMNPSALITVKKTLDQNELVRLSAFARKTLTGPSNAGRVAVLDDDAKLTPITFTPSDAEFLETRKLSNEDVARIFGLPPTSVGITDKATYSNVEHEGRALVQNAIGPLASRIEAAMQRCLLTDVGRRALYIEHDLNGLLRGDVQARFSLSRRSRDRRYEFKRRATLGKLASYQAMRQVQSTSELGAFRCTVKSRAAR
jgi:HK97 family phage portal protein